MLNGNDKGTFYALRALREAVEKNQKPIMIWVGAGASKWCGFPSWQETAEIFHRSYRRSEPEFDRDKARQLLEAGTYPELFDVFRQTNSQRYHREMAELFNSRVPTPVYSRFLNILRAINPLQILTTNIDETLEHNLGVVNTVQRSDLERAIGLVQSKTPFVAKLHGSVSAIRSAVFTSTDYREIEADNSYMKTLEVLFALSSVVFVGYGLRDKYVLKLFEANCNAKSIFGDGPHFLVQSDEPRTLPESVKTIRYLAEPFADHRSAIIVLDVIRAVKNSDQVHATTKVANEGVNTGDALTSGYFISDITPPGTWTSSQSLVLDRGSGVKVVGTIGQGFDDSELPEKVSPAMHDLAVGLLSFEHVYIPLGYASRLHDLLGAITFWDVVRTGIIRFIYFEREPIILFRGEEEVAGGDIGVMHIRGEGGKPLTVEEQVRRQIVASPGNEFHVEKLYEALKACTTIFDDSRFHIPDLTRGALLHPSVRALLGISDATLPTSLPHWVRFPVLRLAHTILVACACEKFALPSTKIGFGSEILVGAAFAVSAARDWADSVSSYVLTNRFNTDLGAFMHDNPAILLALLKFRDTQSGIALRTEILQELATNAGSEFVASVNGGLRRIIPTEVMDNARDQLSGLLFRETPASGVVPAVWTSTRNSDSIARLWRKRSIRELESFCRSRGIRPSSACPCNSGEKLRDCCALSLSK